MSDRIIRILALDPSLTATGWCLLEYNLSTGTTVVVKTDTITGKSLLKKQVDMQSRFERRYIVLWELEKLLVTMIGDMAPDYVVSESAFMHRFVASYAALVLVIQTIRTAAMRTLGRDIHLIAPRESKKAVSDSGAADKATVQEAIDHNPLITIRRPKSNQFEITEHAYDSIAAGMAFIQIYLPSLLAAQKISA
jgi:Holliday junction resolvasome RuvABC endonuclease subunit